MSEIRLQKILAQAGIASRRKAETLIQKGLVSVNGKVVTELGTKADPARDQIEVEGELLKNAKKTEKKVVYLLYKPKSVVSTLKDPEGRKTIVDFFPKTEARLFPVGRLDYDAEGLLLLTNDGDLAYRLTHPSKHVWKEYFVKVKGNIPEVVLAKLRKGPIIDRKQRQPVKVRLLHYKGDKSWVLVSLQEGIKHHIKKMFMQVGFPSLKIKRFSIGPVNLGEMSPGECRRLTQEEVRLLMEETNGKD